MNKTKSIKLETPIGSIESDSGNHFLDLASVVFIILCIALTRKYWRWNG
jgi:hypothetical protein